MFNFTSLLGAKSSSPASLSLIELEGGVKILVDVGWDESFDASLLGKLEQHIPTLSLILLTHAKTSHIGAYAHCCKHFPQFRSIPVYATAPVIALGRSLLQDIYASSPIAASTIPDSALYESSWTSESAKARQQSNILLQPPSTEEIAEYFSLIHPLKYSQPHEPLASPFSPPLNGLSITAYSAGHSLGGTIWHLQHGLESIVYAVDWNQAKDSALQVAAWLGAGGGEVIESLRRPTALVCSSRGSQRVTFQGGKEKRDEHMVNLIKKTIAQGGSVLIPSDTCARSLEIAYFLEEAWTAENLAPGSDSQQTADLFFASASGGLTMRYARSMLEWMDQDIVRDFETAGQQNNNRGKDGKASVRVPFDFKHVRVLERRAQVKKMLLRAGPKVILASDLSLEWGHSRPMFEEFCADPRNLVILTEPMSQTPSGRESISHSLWNLWSSQSSKGKNGVDLESLVDPAGRSISYTHSDVQRLNETENSIYQQYMAREKQKQRSLNPDPSANLSTTDDVIDDNASSSSEESEESDTEQQGKVLNVSATLNQARNKTGLTDAEMGINILIRKKGHFDFDVRGKKGRDRVYPTVPAKRNQRFDDYGEVIRAEDYLRAEEREEEAEQALAKEAAEEVSLGQKRKWGDVAQVNGNAKTNGVSKRRKTADDQDDLLNNDSGYSTTGHAETDDADESEEEEEPKVEGPVKAVHTTRMVSLHMRIAHVDFSGLHDRRSIQMLIPLIRPRKLVLIGGDASETDALQVECEKLLSSSAASAEQSSEIFTPHVDETLDASVDTNAWTVKISDSLRRTLNWQTVGALGVVPLTSHLHVLPTAVESEEHAAKRIKSEAPAPASEENDSAPTTSPSPPDTGVPVLDIVPTGAALSTIRVAARPLHVGDLRLSDLRKLMQSVGFKAEFRGEGTLLVNGQVVVRKSAVGAIEVETVVGMRGFSVTDPTFDLVRRRIYAGLAVISGAGGA